jgi:hypothetical protein
MANKSELLKKLLEIDNEFVEFLDTSTIDDENEKIFTDFSQNNFQQERKAVLGLDIYKYSSFDTKKQNLIPFVFDIIIDDAIKNLNISEKTLFASSFRKIFISTGDGGFLIFETPLHALIFNLYFYGSLHLFNTGHLFPKLSQYIGELVIRSVITYENIYPYEGVYYGKAIITNARMLSKDKLNRFLVDQNTYTYFIRNFNGIETLPILTKEDIKRVLKIEGEIYSWFIYKNEKYMHQQQFIPERIRNVHIQKIENLFEKETCLIIYNIEIQTGVEIYDDKNINKGTQFIYSVGNTNTIK